MQQQNPAEGPQSSQNPNYAERQMSELRALNQLIEKIREFEYIRFDCDATSELLEDGFITPEEAELISEYVKEGDELSGSALAIGWLESSLEVEAIGSATLGERIEELVAVRVLVTYGGPTIRVEFNDSNWVTVISSEDKNVEAYLTHFAAEVWGFAQELHGVTN